MLTKLGEATVITVSDIQPSDTVAHDQAILNQFQRVASELKTIAPKASDFLYFSCVMMTSAEAALLDETGTLKKDSSGKDVTASWEKTGKSWKWVCSDPNIKPFKNSNGDIFPAEELVGVHKRWVSRPLCLDHKSSSVDMIRGVIVDTYYDYKNRRVIALCALDKKNYPDLARKVETGYASSVSMGTGVGTAICYDCGTAASVEAEFCDHMRNKSCYGEINIDLNPIELSIVVNGADPRAKIKHIVAAADSLAQYVEAKEVELSKLALHEMVDPKAVEDIRKELEAHRDHLKDLEDKLKDLEGVAERTEAHEIAEEKGEVPGEAEVKEDEAKAEVSPDMKQASINENLLKVASTIKDMKTSLENFKREIKTLSNEESEMTTTKKAYFQGTEMPTPGQVKYPKEPLSEQARDHLDKQMTPNPDSMGGAAGLFPGDEEKKRHLQRLAAEQKDRELRRQAALNKAKEKIEQKKEGYFQGGGEGNDPAKLPYPKDDYTKNRDKEDKQMVGKKPFPDVGAVDGLFGDDLKTKEKLLRAKLRAKFVKAANPDGTDNLSNSCWQVYADNKLIITATVNDITNGRSDSLYDSVATEDFGRKILRTIKSEGFSKATTLLKGAQAMPEMPAAPAPVEMPAAHEMPAPAAEMPKDEMAGNPTEEVDAALAELDEASVKVKDAVDALKGESSNELASFDDMAKMPEMAPAMASKYVMKAKLASGLLVGLTEAGKELDEHIDELKLAKHVCENLDNIKEAGDKSKIDCLVKDACSDARGSLENFAKLQEAFVMYVKGSNALNKVAQMDLNLHDDAAQVKVKEELPHAAKLVEDVKKDQAVAAPSPWEPKEKVTRDVFAPTAQAMSAEDMNMLNVDMKSGKLEGTPAEVGAAMKAMNSSQPDLTTKEGRAMYREKLAQKGLKFSDMLDKAHPQGGTTTKLDNKVSDDLAKVEDLKEKHEAMMDVATAPPKVRKMAEDIQKLVVKGNIDPVNDFPSLIAQGLDPAAVAYWKKFWGEAGSEGKEFAAELVKEHKEAKAAEQMEIYQVKLARAYELANEMVRKGMISGTRAAVKEQVDEVMKFNDDGFESIKRFVERQDTVKQASMPQVGMLDSQLYLPAPEAAPSDIKVSLDKLFSTRRY